MLKVQRPPRRPQFVDCVVRDRRYRVARWRSQRRCERPLLFFSGIGANIELLAPFLEALHGRDIVTFDMPGIGGSDQHGSPYRLSEMVDVGRQIMSDLEYTELDVMGVSWGGMLAQEFAYRHRRSVGRLVLIATSAGMPMIPGRLSSLWKMITSRRYTGGAWMQPFLETLYGGIGEGLEAYASRMQAPTSTGYLHQVLAILGWTSVRKLTQVRADALIVMGKEDRLVPPANGQILKFLARRARLEILEEAGHLLVLTHRGAVASMVEEFLGGDAVSLPSRTQTFQPITG